MHETNQSTGSIQSILRRVQSLAQKAARDREGCYWIEGVRHFVQACDAKITFDTIIHSEVLLKSRVAEMLARRQAAAGVRRIRITPEQFRSVCKAAHASGIGAIVRQHWTGIEQVRADRGLCWLVVEEIRSPGNLGTILRTAEAVGVGGVVLIGPDCDPFDPAVSRASMGGIFHLQLVRATREQVEQWAGANRVQLIGLSPDAPHLWSDLPIRGPVGIVIGEERRGLSQQLRSICHSTVRLPMTGRADSLNVGVAAGVMMYEMVRRAQSAVGANS